jgi:GntR family transcriptional regulator/MocR family aminotransferase
VVAELPAETDEVAVVTAARERSVGVYGMADYRFPGSLGPTALVLGYGALGERAIQAGVRLLAVAVSRSGRG